MKDYLTEESLGFILDKAFPSAMITPQYKEKALGRTFVIDYLLEVPNETPIFVEFNGYGHYTKQIQINRDYILRDLTRRCLLVEIPYFVQYDSILFEHYYFKQRGVWKEDYAPKYPHGFVDNKAIRPCDFNTAGMNRFMTDIIGLMQNENKGIAYQIMDTIKPGERGERLIGLADGFFFDNDIS